MSISPESSIWKQFITGISLNGIGGGISAAGYALLAKYPLLANLLDSVTGASGTMTRSTTKTYIADDGTVDTAAINTAAFTGSGVLLEPASTNSMLYTALMDTPSWTYFRGTRSTVADADLGVNVMRMTATDTTYPYTVSDQRGITAGAIRYVRVRAKKRPYYAILLLGNFADTNIAGWKFDLNTGTFSGAAVIVGSWTVLDKGITAVNSNWWDVWIKIQTATDTSASARIYSNLDTSTTAASTIGTTTDFWQLDHTSLLSSPILCEGTILTRTAETLSVPSTGYKSNDFSYYIKYTPKIVPTSFSSYILYEDSTAFVALTDATTFNIGIIISGTPYDVNCVVPVVAGTEYKILLSVSPTLITADVNGTISTLAGSFAVTHANPIVIGGIGSGVSSAVVEADFKYINTANVTLTQAAAL